MTDTAPPRPILALTLAVAGKRKIPPATHADLTEGLDLAFKAVATRLGALREMAGRDARMAARFDATGAARLTLITGLADGADQVAGALYLREPAVDAVERRLGAVIPCERQAFLDHSKVEDQDEFRRQVEQCAFVIELDGDMPDAPPKPAMLADGTRAPPTKEQVEKTRARAEAFRAQSEVLLRQSDILLAVDNPLDESHAGGTRETVQSALKLGMPVILLHLGEPGLAILRTEGDLNEPVMLPPGAAYQTIARLVDDLIGLPPATGETDYAAALIKEFFGDHVPKSRWRGRLWGAFDAGFRNAKGPIRYNLWRAWRWLCGERTTRRDEDAGDLTGPYGLPRLRASRLTSYYAGRYRGSFLAGYGLAVIAVFAAVVSLALLPSTPADASKLAWWLLLLLGLAKVGVLFLIFYVARQARKEHLAHRAADYRYLSERLRAMTYLPLAACLRSPVSWSLPYTTRVAAQGVMDQLFAAIARQADPSSAMAGAVVGGGRILRPDAPAASRTIREKWLAGQVEYHVTNHRKLDAMSCWLDRLTRGINFVVIVIAGIDVALMLAEVFHVVPCGLEAILRDEVSPILIAVAAILPAAVASLNGVRFQSECTRLADRSAQMAGELERLRFQAGIAGPRPIRITDALHLANDTARLTLDEVAEWSAIYGKEFVEM